MFGGKGRFIIEEASLPHLPIRATPEQHYAYTKDMLKQVHDTITANHAQARAASA